MAMKAKDEITLMDAIINTARLNSGFIQFESLIPVLIRQGLLSSTRSNHNLQGILLETIRRSKKFELVKFPGQKGRSVFKLKEHTQFKGE